MILERHIGSRHRGRIACPVIPWFCLVAQFSSLDDGSASQKGPNTFGPALQCEKMSYVKENQYHHVLETSQCGTDDTQNKGF
jgi:hypothetical protein